MTKQEFKEYWQKAYPGTVPILHELREVFKDRLIRIPAGTQALSDEDAAAELIRHQNALISEIFDHEDEFYLLWGQYDLSGELNPAVLDHEIASLALSRVSREEYPLGSWYRLFLKKEKWTSQKFESLLQEISRDKKNVLFIGKDQECLLAPNAGSLDIFVKDSKIRDQWELRLNELI